MLTPRLSLSRRVTAALDGTRVADSGVARRLRQRPSDRLLQQQLRDRLGRGAAQSIDIDRTARRQNASCERSPPSRPSLSPTHRVPGRQRAGGVRRATLAFFTRSRSAASEPATFLLDEFLELRTFESFQACAASCMNWWTAVGERQPASC